MSRPEILTGKFPGSTGASVRKNRTWIIPLGRFGHASNGIVYLLVGAQAAMGAIRGVEGSLDRLTVSPWGQVALGTLVVGLAGYALWNYVQAIFDTEDAGGGLKGVIDRASYVVVGLLYSSLAWTATRLLFGEHSAGSRDTNAEWTARFLAQPHGQWIVGIVGTVVTIVGIIQFYRAWSADFKNKLKLGEMSREEELWALRVARIGYVARGIVGTIAGAFFFVAAVEADPKETKSLSESLVVVADQAYGPWLLTLVALGLAAYGVFMIVLARYRKMLL